MPFRIAARRTFGLPPGLSLALLLASPVAAQSPPPPPALAAPLLERFLRDPGQPAVKAWKPMGASAPAHLHRLGRREILELPCNLQAATLERASWDRAILLDLSARNGVELQIFCPDLTPVSSLSLYFHSGAGWYHAHLEGIAPGRWSTVRVRKSETSIEGKPAGWGRIDTLRLSAWRAQRRATALYLGGLSSIGGSAAIALVRCESPVRRESAKLSSILSSCSTTANLLEHLGLAHDLISDEDIDARHLAGRKLLILPHNPTLPAEAARALLDWLEHGGRLICFFQVPAPLRTATGIAPGAFLRAGGRATFASIRSVPGKLAGAPAEVAQASWNIVDARAIPGRSEVAAWWIDQRGKPTGHAAILVSKRCIQMTHILLAGDRGRKGALLLAMVGHWLPSAWVQAARAALAAASALDGRPIPAKLKARAAELRRPAEQLLARGRAREAFEQAVRARSKMIAAWCATLASAPGEQRAWWCHSAFGIAGMSWDEAIALLARNGFNAIFANMLWGGLAYYPSKILPVSPLVAEQGDQLRACLEACRRHGVQCHIWKVNWNLSTRAPREFVERMVREARVQVRFDGSLQREWLCPSHPANQRLEIDAMIEVATAYPVDGIHFDYIRYPGEQTCFCPGCRARFERWIGQAVTPWPRALRGADTLLRRRWREFRRRNISAVVAAVSRRARQVRPGLKISAAVFPNLELARDGVAQDWGEWCRRGYLDFICPMDYTPDGARFERLVRRQLHQAGDVPCFPGIGLSTWDGEADIIRIVEQIQTARRLGCRGFTVFNYGAREAREILPLLGRGLTRR